MARARDAHTHRFSPFTHAGPLYALAARLPGPTAPRSVERVIAARWRWWVPWVRMRQLRAPAYDSAVASAQSGRLRQRHAEHILDLMREGISMRTMRRHRLDDPRITDEVRTVLMEAAKERQSKARYRRPEDQRAEDKLATLINLGTVVRCAATTAPTTESPER